MKLGKLVLSVAMLALCGCIPAYYIYWAPAAVGGQLISSRQSGSSITPSDAIEFSFSDVRIRITSAAGNEIGVILSIPKGRSASFSSSEVTLLEGDLQTPVNAKLTLTRLDTDPKRDLRANPTDTMNEGYYTGLTRFGTSERSQFYVILPMIKIDGQAYEIPKIEFTKKSGFGIFGP
jgi:hypothetical protein